jgi:outer membrane protein OmpA-like peptidoglycan-associated protein
MTPRFIVIAAILVHILTAPHAAKAQARGFAVNRFEPADRGSEWFANESLDFRGNVRPALGLVFDWAYKPLLLRKPDDVQGDSRGNVITDQVFVHAGGVLVFRDRFRVGADVPIALYQDGEDIAAVAVAARAPDKPAFGDVRLSGDVRIIGEYGAAFSAAIGAQVHLPTGSRSLFTGDGTVRVTPRVLVAGNVEGFPYAAKLGFAVRPFDSSFEGRPLGSEAIFSLAVGVKANDQFVFGPELYGSTVVTGGDGAFKTRNTPLELLVGAHLIIANHWQAGTAIGPGFTRGDGSPTMRVLFSVEFAPDVCVDKDGDGICANVDACPEVDGVRTTDPKTNGCPSDRDHDGFIDKEDACPDERGARTVDPKTTGCPDRDKDGVADREDACIDVAGVATDDPKTNGCPTAAAPVEKLVITEQVAFEPGKTEIDAAGGAALEAVARTMREHPEVRVRVEGHADEHEGTAADQKRLGDARAAAATKWLEEHGIAGARLRSEGYAAERMIDTTGTEQGRRRNRRVELHVLEEAATAPAGTAP